MVTIVVLIFFGLTTSSAADGFPTVVKTKYGKVMGFEDANDTIAWKGIPFAKPPLGKLRWKAPVGPDTWSGVRQATEFCDACPQYVQVLGQPNVFSFAGSEDCLYLNVWRPDSEETDLPVYFWIHGGGNSTGASSVKTYDGAYLANQSNLVVVSINYRLGPLGWFTHPALRKGKGKSLSNSGNFGTLDIIKALKWVKGNIEAFGGDRKNITIAGESAGGTNVLSLIVSPLAGKHKLFHKAISQSGPFTEIGDTITISEVDAGELHANQVIRNLLINDGAEEGEAQNMLDGMTDKEIRNYLAEKSAKDIFGTYEPGAGGMITFPYCFKDGTVIHKDGTRALGDPEEYNQVPMILGSNKEEHKLFMAGSYPTFELGYYSYYNNYYFYPNNGFYLSYDSFYQGYAENTTNSWWKPICVDNIATIAADPSKPDIYVYRFDYGAYSYINYLDGDTVYPLPFGYNAWPVDSTWQTKPALRFGAGHALDIPFFMGNYFYYNLEGLIFRTDNRISWEALTHDMMAYVKNFAYTGDPNGLGLEEWEPWSNEEGGPKRILLDADLNGADIVMIYE